MGENSAELTPLSDARRHFGATGPRNLALVLFVLFAAVAWNQSLIHWRENVLDSYLFGFYGWRVAHAARPYLDVWDNKPPGIWWANALAFRIFGDGPQADWAIGSASLLITLLAFVGTARIAWHPSMVWPAAIVGGLLLTNVMYECGANRTEALVSACEVAGVYCYSRWLRSRRRVWLVAAGALLGAAPWCKQAGLGAGLGVGVHLLFTMRRKSSRPLAWLIAGAALPSIAGMSLLAWQGALGAARYAVFDFNRLYFEIGDASWWRLARPLELYAPALWPLALPSAVALLVPLVVRSSGAAATDGRGGEPTAFRLVLWVWLIVTLYLVCVGVGRLAYHLMPVLPPLGLLLLQPLGRIAAVRGLGQAVIRRPSVGGLVVLTIGAALHVAAAGWPDARQCLARRPPDAGWLPATPPQYARQAVEIHKWCPPGAAIYVWGWSPGTYRFAYRANACRFGTLEKTGHFGDRARFIVEEVVRTLRDSPPAVLSISAIDLLGIRGNSADPLCEWLVDNYQDGGEWEGMHVLHRR